MDRIGCDRYGMEGEIGGLVGALSAKERQVRAQLLEREQLKKRIQITRLALTHARKRTDSLRNSHVRLENRTRELRQRTAKQRERNFHLWRKVDQNGLDTERVQDILQHYRLESAVLEQEVDLERNAVETVAELRDEAARILSEKQEELRHRKKDAQELQREEQFANIRLETANRKKELVSSMVKEFLAAPNNSNSATSRTSFSPARH